MLRKSKSLGGVLVAIGAILLILQLVNINVSAFAWPLFILMPGLLMLGAALFGESAGLAVPGSIVSTVGLILFVQNVTGRFESWAYAWGLILAAVGLGTFMQGRLTQTAKLEGDGRRLAVLGLGLFATFGLLFELFIFGGLADSFVWRYLLPLALIGGGAFMLLRRPEQQDVPRQPPQPKI